MKLTTILSSTVALTLVMAAVGCDKPEDKGDEAKAEAKVEAKAETSTKDPAELLEASKTPELPGPLSKLQFGMSADDAKKAAPELEDGGKSLGEYRGAYFSYYVPDDSGKLKSASLQIEGVEMAKLLTEAWGEPNKGEDLGKPKYFWFNEAKKIRATVSEGYGKEDEVQFQAYLPAKELLGEGKELLGFEKPDRPLLGATAEELDAAYADVVENVSAQGPAPSSNIDLLPTELGSQFTRINPIYGDDGKINRFLVSITWAPYPPAKDEILGLIKAKWGEPKEEELSGKKLLVFSESPRIVVEDDTTSKEWDIAVEAPK